MWKQIKRIISIFVLASVFMPSLYACSQQKFDVSNYKIIEDFDKKGVKIGTFLGSTCALSLEKYFHNATIEQFGGGPELLKSLDDGKIEAIVFDEISYYLLKGTYEFLKQVDNITIDKTSYAICFPKTTEGAIHQKEFNAFLSNIKQNGKLQSMIDFWFDLELSPDVEVDFSDLENVNGNLVMYTEAQARPFSFMYYNKNVGFDLALVKEYCKEYGYSLNLVRTSSILPALTTSKCDIAGSGIEIIDERKDKILYSDPIYENDNHIYIRDPNYVKTRTGLIEGLKDDFYNTFISENRYKLFIDGVIITIIISVLTLIFGTILGFLLYLAYYNGFKNLAKIFHFLSWLFSRLPMLVFLMLILYVVFARIDISGMYVAIISFTTVFATTIFTILENNVRNIDYGQIEAASSLGYNKTKTFFRIILLQILPNILPTYEAEILNLVKSTSIVGYVMVSDLTKAGDIVRSRTYSAFFPLIVVAFMYIILAKILTMITRLFGKILQRKLKIEKERLKETKYND